MNVIMAAYLYGMYIMTNDDYYSETYKVKMFPQDIPKVRPLQPDSRHVIVRDVNKFLKAK